ncbi:Leucine-rich repeat-containing protein 56 [Apodemus speciosus]|uniref:Leucine-rich repeat-containing protein 56 n=1 Tax=Apodemus speciosus TaxID=105296 RepID=A0ABQ0F0U2_APOSI
MFDLQQEPATFSGWTWMDPAWDGSQGSRPGTASIRVRELSWQGLNNPHPQNKRLGSHGDIHRERRVEEHLSPARLALAQGSHLPNLTQLKLNHSCLGSLSGKEASVGGKAQAELGQDSSLEAVPQGQAGDLGTSLGHLQVLWLARCGLTDLDGIGSFLALKELYVSYNNISDLSPLCLLEQLEVLDLEGNNVEDLGQMRYLQLCPRLATLTLEGNLVCLKPDPGPCNKAPQDYNYRAEVTKLIPQLHILDEVPTTCTNLPAPQKLSQDWLMVKEAIKEGSVLDILLPRLGRPDTYCRRWYCAPTPDSTRDLNQPSRKTGLHPYPKRTGFLEPEEKRPPLVPQAFQRWDCPHGATIRKLDPSLPVPETQPWTLSLLVPGGPLPEALLSENPATEDHASNLTHGPGQVLCGNPTKGLRERRNQYQEWAPLEQLPPHRPDLAIRPSTPRPDPAESCDLAMTGLRAWREPGLRLSSSPKTAGVPAGKTCSGPSPGPTEGSCRTGRPDWIQDFPNPTTPGLRLPGAWGSGQEEGLERINSWPPSGQELHRLQDSRKNFPGHQAFT